MNILKRIWLSHVILGRELRASNRMIKGKGLNGLTPDQLLGRSRLLLRCGKDQEAIACVGKVISMMDLSIDTQISALLVAAEIYMRMECMMAAELKYRDTDALCSHPGTSAGIVRQAREARQAFSEYTRLHPVIQ